MWISRKNFEAVKTHSQALLKNNGDLIALAKLQELHIELAHKEILRLNQEIARLKAIKPELKIVKNDRA